MVAKNERRALAVAAFSSLIANHSFAQASDTPWSARIDLQGFLNSYGDAADRDSLTNLGFFLHADYFERGGLTVGYNRTAVNAGSGFDDVDQNSRFISGRVAVTPDWLSGRLTLRLDRHSISSDGGTRRGNAGNGSGGNGGNNGPGPGAGQGSGSDSGSSTGSTDAEDSALATGRVDATAAQISYLNFPGTFYWDLGITKSEFEDLSLDGRNLEIDQITSTIGLGFNDRRDWLQLRAYLIDASVPALALGQDDTTALELKWTHWPLGGGVLGLDNYRLGVLAGDRVFAADPDAGSLFNLAELQTGIVSIGGEWALTEHSRVLLLLGAEAYENSVLDRDYRSTFLLLNISHRWE